MYPVAVESRDSSNNLPLTQPQPQPQQHTLQVHMHHVCCPCSSSVVYPYYPGYRPTPHPLLQPASLPRPSYLHHYQYTQFHVNNSPYNLPFPPGALPLHQGYNPPSTVDVAFGPPPRDRRNLDVHECDATPEPSQIVTGSEEDAFIEFLVKGCLAGERIAKRNEHRPCFKNIQNLCSRTRSEVAKPNITVSNIHSQGVPWATKDFIFAFVRAVNCWSILRGYLGLNTPGGNTGSATSSGGLGKVDREISPGFRQCYVQWEQRTKELAHHLVETFCKLDEVNSSPVIETDASRTKIRERIVYDKEVAALKGIPGILHIPLATEFRDVRNLAADTTREMSPRCEDSDNEGRIYMKPGSYSVPTLGTRTHTNVTIEFLDTAQNVSTHHRKIAAEQAVDAVAAADKAWQAAQNVTPEFIKQNEDPLPQPNQVIENWLNSSHFDEHENVNDGFKTATTESLSSLRSDGLECTSPIISKKQCSDFIDQNTFSKTYSNFRRHFVTNPTNYEFQNGGLTEATTASVEKVFKELESSGSDLDGYNIQSADDGESGNPFTLALIGKKVRAEHFGQLNVTSSMTFDMFSAPQNAEIRTNSNQLHEN